MDTRRIVLHHATWRKLRRDASRSEDARYATRCRIILRLAAGVGVNETARQLACSPSTVTRTRDRWIDEGWAGLVDRREDNGTTLADETYIDCVRRLLEGSPQKHGHRRPTWTKRLLILIACRQTGITVSLTTMYRVLRTIGARRGRGKPLGPCPWSERRRKKRMNLIHGLIESLPANQACVWEDEADIDLNPKIGVDWTLPGAQRLVMTPGKNVKRYFAAAMDATTDKLTWVRSTSKSSDLFIALLKRLLNAYADKRTIHVILDNYTIHSSRRTLAWIAEHGGKFRFHFLPPYSPDDNRIERKLWREVHANVTIHHRCRSIDELCHEVVLYLKHRNLLAVRVSESRAAI